MSASPIDEPARSVASEGYNSAREIVCEALRPTQGAEAREAEPLLFLRQAWQAGIDSGDAGDMDFDALKHEVRARLHVQNGRSDSNA